MYLLFKRLFRHLCMTPLQLRRHFPNKVQANIEAAIAASEAMHAGEIRFAVELNLSLTELLARKSGRERALQVFSDLRVWDTEYNNGVLIYLLLADHDIEIVADRGICQHVGQQGWQRISDAMEFYFKAGDFEGGVRYGINEIGHLLAQHYPARMNHQNELPNAPVFI
jgi:uncharacterized membrane protein